MNKIAVIIIFLMFISCNNNESAKIGCKFKSQCNQIDKSNFVHALDSILYDYEGLSAGIVIENSRVFGDLYLGNKAGELYCIDGYKYGNSNGMIYWVCKHSSGDSLLRFYNERANISFKSYINKFLDRLIDNCILAVDQKNDYSIFYTNLVDSTYSEIARMDTNYIDRLYDYKKNKGEIIDLDNKYYIAFIKVNSINLNRVRKKEVISQPFNKVVGDWYYFRSCEYSDFKSLSH